MDKLGNIGVVVTARVNSRRLHQKVLQEINGRKTIEILLDHVIPQDDAYPVCLAIREDHGDNILADIAKIKGVDCYRGQDDSPFHRLYECAKQNGWDYVVRITADDILIDQSLMRKQIKFHIQGGQDYTYMGRCPEGIAAEVITVSALERAVKIVGDKPVEFTSYYLKTKNFDIKEYYPPPEYQWSFRLTMDYEQDLTILRAIFALLKDPFGTLDIINLLKERKYLLQINKLPKVTVYTCNYNQGKYVIDCMESVIAQTFKDYEFIIVDDCSNDGSLLKIVEYYSRLDKEAQDKIRIIRNDKNIGLPASCNKVLDMARGKFIMRVDSDDVIRPDAIEMMIMRQKMDGTQGVISGYYETKEGLTTTAAVVDNRWHPGCCCLSRWAVNELRFKEDIEYLEGKEFFERFKKLYDISFIREPLWYYRQHDESKTADPRHPNNG